MLLQEKMIETVKTKALADARIDAVLMYGSFTQGAGDCYADIEFYVFYYDEEQQQLNRREWVADIHPLYCYFTNTFGTEVAIFRNLIRGEFHFLPVSELAVVESFADLGYFPDAAAMCLCDKRGELWPKLQKLQDCHIDRSNPEEVSALLHDLFNNLLYGINVYKRGEYARSLECLLMAQRFLVQGLRLLEKQTHHWFNPLKALEQELSPQAYATFQSCTADLDKRRIHAAYQSLLTATTNLAQALQQNYGMPDYRDMLQDIARYFQENQAGTSS